MGGCLYLAEGKFTRFLTNKVYKGMIYLSDKKIGSVAIYEQQKKKDKSSLFDWIEELF